MRIVSINTNKGLHGDRRAPFEKWLAGRNADLLLIQEPTVEGRPVPGSISGLSLVLGNECVAAYAANSQEYTAEFVEQRWLRLSLGTLVIDNAYLPHETSRGRKEFLEHLVAKPASERMIVGDFNMAPRAADGRYGDAESRWTGAGERKAFGALLETGLTDLGAIDPPEFTFQHQNKGDWTRFRCDLALVGHALGARARLTIDSVTRNPTVGFTDHSALILDLSDDPAEPA